MSCRFLGKRFRLTLPKIRLPVLGLLPAGGRGDEIERGLFPRFGSYHRLSPDDQKQTMKRMEKELIALGLIDTEETKKRPRRTKRDSMNDAIGRVRQDGYNFLW